MDRSKLREIVSSAVGDPASGPVADSIDTIVDAILKAQTPTREKRVTEPEETRG